MTQAEFDHAEIARHYSAPLAKARAELESRRQLVEDQVRRYRESEDAATALAIGKDAPPVSPKVVFLVTLAAFVLELAFTKLGFDAISF